MLWYKILSSLSCDQCDGKFSLEKATILNHMDGQSVILIRHIYLLNHINQTDRHIHTHISNGSLKHESNNFSPPIRFFCTIICVVKLLRHYLLDISCEKDTRINCYRLLLQTKLRRFGILAAENKIKGIWNNGDPKINSSTTFFRSMLQCAHEKYMTSAYPSDPNHWYAH